MRHARSGGIERARASEKTGRPAGAGPPLGRALAPSVTARAAERRDETPVRFQLSAKLWADRVRRRAPSHLNLVYISSPLPRAAIHPEVSPGGGGGAKPLRSVILHKSSHFERRPPGGRLARARERVASLSTLSRRLAQPGANAQRSLVRRTPPVVVPAAAGASRVFVVKRPSARRGPGIVSVDRNVRSKCRCSCVLQFTS